MSKEPLLTLTLPVEYARILADAAELYARLGIGQYGELLQMARDGLVIDREGQPTKLANIEAAEPLLNEIKRLLTGYPANASHGIYAPTLPKRFQYAHAVEKAIRHRLAWDTHPQGGTSVQFDEPLFDVEKPVSASTSPTDDVLDKLSPTMALTRNAQGHWQVFRIADRRLMAESASLQTAIARGCADAED